MNQDNRYSIHRIGRAIYPFRVFGFILFGTSTLLFQSIHNIQLDVCTLTALTFCLIYPHLAFLRYLKQKSRQVEIEHMLADMILLGLLIACVNFNPIIALPYLIANSAANYALRGMRQVAYGLFIVIVSALSIGAYRAQSVIVDVELIELIAPFLYLTLVTHFMGHLAYVRGISLIKRKRKAEITSQQDFLTGLKNRRYIFNKIKQKDAACPSNDSTLIMADIDYFKQINDTYGHDHGDAVLVQVSQRIKQSLNHEAIIARWGGEEFLVYLPNTNTQKGALVADEIRKAVMDAPVNFGGINHEVTMTLGVASYTTNSRFESTLQRADMALYEGKTQGRNQVIVADREQ